VNSYLLGWPERLSKDRLAAGSCDIVAQWRKSESVKHHMGDPDNHAKVFNPLWRAIFAGELPQLQRGRKMLRLLSPTASHRCRLCYAGFDGISAPMMRAIGRGQWLRNPHYCKKCESVLAEQRGGAEIEIAVLYADVRGSTQLAARLGPTEFAALMQRYFQIAIKVFTWSDAIVDKMVGDEVIGIYVPSLTGADYRQRAVRAGLELLRATGHTDPAGPWLSIAVGVHSGETFMGSIGVDGGNYQFAALGDPMNFGARLVAAANGGELIISEVVWSDVSSNISAEPRNLELKGYAEPVRAYVVRAA
jgi:adenylate cyclase